MANEATKPYVKESIFQEGFWLWGKQIQDHTGFSLEVFRDNHHILSLASGEGAGRLLKGDQILEINLGPIPLTWQGSLYTEDGYTREYDARVTVRVKLGIDPDSQLRYSSIFAIRYLQQLDPLAEVRQAINAVLVNAAARDRHDELEAIHLRAIITGGCPHLPSQYGVMLDDRENLSLIPHPDPRWVEIQKIKHDGVITDLQNDILRIQRAKDADHDIHIKMKQQTSEVILEEKLDQLREYLRDRYSLRQIVEMDEDMPRLLLTMPEYKMQVEQILLEKSKQQVIDAPRTDIDPS